MQYLIFIYTKVTNEFRNIRPIRIHSSYNNICVNSFTDFGEFLFLILHWLKAVEHGAFTASSELKKFFFIKIKYGTCPSMKTACRAFNISM